MNDIVEAIRPVAQDRSQERIVERIASFPVPQVVEVLAEERISERSIVTMSPKTKKAKRDGDHDAMLDEAIAQARKLLDVQLSTLKTVIRYLQMSGTVG